MHLIPAKRLLFIIVACLAPTSSAWAQFDFEFDINPNLIDSSTSPGTITGTITEAQEADLAAALDRSAAFWQQFIVGFQPGVSSNLTGIDISVGLNNFAPTDGQPNGPGGTLASAGPSGFFFNSGGFTFATTSFSSPSRLGGVVNIDSADFVNLDSALFTDTLNHEIGHALGFGTLFDLNGVLVDETGQYTGEQGLATYQEEFDPNATFIPIELDGGPGTRNGHINETIGFGSQEDLILNPNTGPGEPTFIDDPAGENDPGDISAAPTVLLAGDNFERSLNDDLLTGRLNFNGGAFLSDTTVATFQDIGFQVVLPSQVSSVPEPSSLLVLGLIGLAATRRRRS